MPDQMRSYLDFEKPVAELEAKISQLQEMADALTRLADACEGDSRPECPIIRGLEGSQRVTIAPRDSHAALT